MPDAISARAENATTSLRDLPAKFLRDGWFQFALEGQELVEEIRTGLLAELRAARPDIVDLESYHRFVEDDEEHIALQKRLQDWFIAKEYGPTIIARNLDVFRSVAGPDLFVQAKPYIRALRPGKPRDSVGIHRDTHYGGSPYEMSVHIPFTETGLEGSLGVISGSHVQPDSAYPYEHEESQTVTRGSVRHQLGFLYAPKVMRSDSIAALRATGTRLGQAMAFSLSIVHGQVVNQSTVTRFSTDVRVVHALAPIDWAKNSETGYYRPLVQSPLVQAAEAFYRANTAAGDGQGDKPGLAPHPSK